MPTRFARAPSLPTATIGALIAAITLAFPAWADGSGFGREGLYVSVGVGGAQEAFSGLLDLSALGIDPGTAFLIGGRIGARANKYFAFEGAVDYSITGLELQVPLVGSFETKTLIATGNLKLYPGAWRIQPFAMGGIGLVRATNECKNTAGVVVSCAPSPDSATVFAGRFGAGLDVYLTRNVAITGEVTYVIPTDVLSDLDFYTFGGQLLYRF